NKTQDPVPQTSNFQHQQQQPLFHPYQTTAHPGITVQLQQPRPFYKNYNRQNFSTHKKFRKQYNQVQPQTSYQGMRQFMQFYDPYWKNRCFACGNQEHMKTHCPLSQLNNLGQNPNYPLQPLPSVPHASLPGNSNSFSIQNSNSKNFSNLINYSKICMATFFDPLLYHYPYHCMAHPADLFLPDLNAFQTVHLDINKSNTISLPASVFGYPIGKDNVVADYLSRVTNQEQDFDSEHVLDPYLLVLEEDPLANFDMVKEQLADPMIASIIN
ncbi:unnamed protein product, partial [Brachionus calyciflorus]